MLDLIGAAKTGGKELQYLISKRKVAHLSALPFLSQLATNWIMRVFPGFFLSLPLDGWMMV